MRASSADRAVARGLGLGRLLVAALAASACSGDRSPSPSPSTIEQRTGALAANDKPGGNAAGKDTVTAWVVLKERANLAGVNRMRDWKARGKAVHENLQNAANSSQAGLRAWLTSRNIDHKPFWIVNTIKVTTNKATLAEIAKRPDVAEILDDKTIPVPPLVPAAPVVPILGTEWGLDNIRVPEAWQTFGAFGDGIVVANVDTGVQFDHPALVNQYRGRQSDGTFNHNYNWYDPSLSCGNPSLAPCDNNNHGTHTMGTMVGDDGTPGTNRIGVAPHARWIAAKGCEQSSCSTASLLAAGQWILAPTDLNGLNPRPDLRPNIVNNSWGGGGGSNFYQQIVQSWVAAGIFPAFSNGNSGSSCSTSGSPGDYPESYSAGAYDVNNIIASFSSRGPSAFGGIIKPNIAAPGVSVRSSIPGNSYASFSGTSMASPHLSGSVALLWSAAPSLIGDIATTEALLSQTARDTSDTTCGGTATNNNVWGEGRLDVFAAIDQAPRGPTGTLNGTVTSSSGTPLAGATITVAASTRTTGTDAAGVYQMTLPVGSYSVTASAYGYQSQTAVEVGITQGATTVQNFQLTPLPSHALSGQVRDEQGGPVANTKVTILGTPLAPAVTGSDGRYSFPSVIDGGYDVKVDSNACLTGQTLHTIINANTTLDFTVTARRDSFGYSCQAAAYSFIDANTVLPLTGDDSSLAVTLPFSFTFYGQAYNTMWVGTNGFVNFNGFDSTFSNSGIPSSFTPNAAIYPMWDDLFIDGTTGSIRTEVVGTAPNRRFVIEWRTVTFFAQSVPLIRFEIVLSENGQILLQYATVGSDGRAQGNSATIGIENSPGTVALQYAFNQAVLSDGQAIAFIPPSGPPGNTAPVVSAGADQAITLPAAASLVGTATDDGQPNPPGALTTTWSAVSGPGTVTFGNPAALATGATFSVAGTYFLRLTASDGSLSANDDVVVIVNPAPPVNQPPVVNAGPDQTITLPAAASLSGTVTDDNLPNPPAIVTTTWSVVAGVGTVTFANAANRTTTATFSAAGTYTLRLTASDSALSASDDIVVIVNPPVNQAPTVNAGPDQTITLPATASLSGTANDDGLPAPPATLTTTWSVVTGVGTVTFANPANRVTTATFSAAGTYTLRLTASDSALSASDDIVVTVNSAPVNQPPTVNAGPDQTITLPATASLSGTASDDGLPNPPATLTTTWSMVNGPAGGTVTFGNASARATTASFSAAGSYTLRLTANDSALSRTDDIVITVNAAPVNQAPTVNAGPDQTITSTLPASANLSGTASDDHLPNPPNTLTTTWSTVSVPTNGTVTFGNASALATTATFSVAGSYTLRLTANDSALSRTDDIVITVNAASGNSPCAGLCTNPVNFSISGSFQSGNLGTTAVCYQTTAVIHGGNCGNFVSPRTLKVNGTTEPCTGGNWASIPATRNGGYCIQTTAGNQSYAYFTAW